MSSTSTQATTEIDEVNSFKFVNFVKILGPDWPLDDIHALIDSEIYHGDLKNLLERGCSKELALKILL
jgi:hypothetical protein